MIKFLDLYHQYLSIQSEIDQVIRSTIENSAYIGGAALKEFETAFADFSLTGCAVCSFLLIRHSFQRVLVDWIHVFHRFVTDLDETFQDLLLIHTQYPLPIKPAKAG